jgi:hypothetical protein
MSLRFLIALAVVLPTLAAGRGRFGAHEYS